MFGLIRRLFAWIERRYGSVEQVRWHLKQLLWSVNMHVPMQDRYERFYGVGDTAAAAAGQSTTNQNGPTSEMTTRTYKNDQSAKRPLLFEPTDLEPNSLVDYSKFMQWLRLVPTVWMAYMIVKYLTLEYLITLVDYPQRQPPPPLSCYVMGRFILRDKFEVIMTFVMACLRFQWHITSRLIRRPCRMSAIYFLLLSEREVNSFYSMIYAAANREGHEASYRENRRIIESDHHQAGGPSIVLTRTEIGDLWPRELFILETMCFKIKLPGKVMFALRPNRTPERHVAMRRLFAKLVIASSAWSYQQLVVTLALVGLPMLLGNHHAQFYPQCEQAPWWHSLVAATFDLAENLSLWLEGSLASSLNMCLLYILNRDLILYWQSVQSTIGELQAKARQNHNTAFTSSRHVACRFKAKRAIVALQAEILDFFDQVDRVDMLVSDYINMAVFGWLFMTFNLVYTTQIERVERLPTELILLIALFVCFICIASYIFLTLQRLCARSYTTLCALMAHDCSGCHHGYGTIVDLFKRRKDCYTLLRAYSFKWTTLLQLLGYSFTCFALVVSLFRYQTVPTAADCHCPI